MLAVEVISKKRAGKKLSKEEIDFFIASFSKNKIPDYQMSAFLMAVFFQSMDMEETTHLTLSMMNSGKCLDFSNLSFPTVDKHSTGGVGDKASLILGPIVASYNIGVPMIAGRGLGHTGGTIDKLESIGFNCNLSLNKFKTLIKKNHISIIAQTPEICPADKRMYSLRDVTATVESIPLICGSIMSKKLAEGAQSLVLDVKFGSGAFMEKFEDAKNLGLKLQEIGKKAARNVSVLLTSMNQPLGEWIGNACEIQECIEILKGEKKYSDTLELSLKLAAEMLLLTKVAKSFDEGFELAKKSISNGSAFEKFEKMVSLQGGNTKKIPRPKKFHQVLSKDDGFVSSFKTREIGMAAVLLKAGREKTSDVINPVSGIQVHKKIGDRISKNEPIFTIFSDRVLNFKEVDKRLSSSYAISEKFKKEELIKEILR